MAVASPVGAALTADSDDVSQLMQRLHLGPQPFDAEAQQRSLAWLETATSAPATGGQPHDPERGIDAEAQLIRKMCALFAAKSDGTPAEAFSQGSYMHFIAQACLRGRGCEPEAGCDLLHVYLYGGGKRSMWMA